MANWLPSRSNWLPPRRRLWVGLGIAGLGPLGLALGLLPVRDHVDGAAVGLAMLVPTAVATAVGGPAAALVAVVVGSATHNLLFTEPYLTLFVTHTTDVVGLVAHTIVGVAVSLVVVREQRVGVLVAAREEQAARVRLLEEVDRVRTALLGAVSHDLRTPLAAIAAAASDLQATDVTFSDQERAVLAETIGEQATRLDRTVTNLLDAGRLQAGAVTITPEAVEVEDLVAEATAGIQSDQRSRIRLRNGRPVPPVLVDPVLIVAAIRNLLENAVRFGPEGTPIDVTAEAAGSAVLVSVRDHGPGLDGTRSGDVFEAFSGSRTDANAGLGLAICRGFVEAHGGMVEYHSGVEGGAVFEVLLPAVEDPEL